MKTELIDILARINRRLDVEIKHHGQCSDSAISESTADSLRSAIGHLAKENAFRKSQKIIAEEFGRGVNVTANARQANQSNYGTSE